MDDDRSDKRIAPFGLRMPPDLKARIQAAADASNRSMNAEIVATLQEKYPAPTIRAQAIHTTIWVEYIEDAADEKEEERRFQEYRDRKKASGRGNKWLLPRAEWVEGWLRSRGKDFNRPDLIEELRRYTNEHSD